jgi:Ca-activated chloride channel family protein
VPQIFTRETMQASRSAIKEDLYDPAPVTEHPMMAGFESAAFPPVLGYVMARPKPTSQVLLAVESGDPLLAVGRFGLGTGVAFTGDLTERWGSEWLAWQGCGKFWAQVFRGALRKEESVGIETSSVREKGRWEIDVRALDDAGRPLGAVPWNGHALDDQGGEHPVAIEESGIGRYRVRVDPGDAERLTLRLHDLQQGKVKTLRWERGYPAEYRLAGEPDASLATVAGFDVSDPRAGIPEVRVRSSALPWAGLVALVFLIAGIVLRRV